MLRCKYFNLFTVTTLMDQVCTLAQFSTVGWEGFNHDPPTLQDCLDAIHTRLDPGDKIEAEVSIL